MCPNQAPFFDVTAGLWMGFVASQDHGTNADCCDCYTLDLQGSVSHMVVQITNHGQVNGLFDLLLPGGGFGDFAGCQIIFPRASEVPQDRYGGLHAAADCDLVFSAYPEDAAACKWMFQAGMFPYPSPGIAYPGSATITRSQKVTCPASLNARSGCAATGGLSVPPSPPHPPSSANPPHQWSPPHPPSAPGGAEKVVFAVFAVCAGLVGTAAAGAGVLAPTVFFALILSLWVGGTAFGLLQAHTTLQLWPAVGASVGAGAAAALAALAFLRELATVAVASSAGFAVCGIALRAAAPSMASVLRPSMVGLASGTCGVAAAAVLYRSRRSGGGLTLERALQLVTAAAGGSYGVGFAVGAGFAIDHHWTDAAAVSPTDLVSSDALPPCGLSCIAATASTAVVAVLGICAQLPLWRRRLGSTASPTQEMLLAGGVEDSSSINGRARRRWLWRRGRSA